MRCSIIIVNYNGWTNTRACLESLLQWENSSDTEIIVVDNCSSDDSVNKIRTLFPNVIVLPQNENKGFGAANNAGVNVSSGEYLFFLNNDTILTSSVIGHLISEVSNKKDAAVCAPGLRNSDGTFQLSFGEYPDIISEWKAKRVANDSTAQRSMEPSDTTPVRKDWVSGAAMMFKRDAFIHAGGFDEEYFMYFEDSDLCKTVTKHGLSVWYAPSVTLIHLGGSSYGKRDRRIEFEYRKSQQRYYAKHNSAIQRFVLMLFLWFKYGPRLLKDSERSLAFNIIQSTLTRK